MRTILLGVRLAVLLFMLQVTCFAQWLLPDTRSENEGWKT